MKKNTVNSIRVLERYHIAEIVAGANFCKNATGSSRRNIHSYIFVMCTCTNWTVKTSSSWIIRENSESLHHVKISLYTVLHAHAAIHAGRISIPPSILEKRMWE